MQSTFTSFQQKPNKKKTFFKKTFIFFILICLFLSIFTLAYFYYLSFQLPDISVLIDPKYDLPTQIYDRNQQLVDEYYIQKRVLIPYEKIPKVMINALIAVEDNRYYDHFGIDPIRILKAMWVDLKCLCIREGASTLTQQTAKLFLLSSAKKIERKIKEVLLALKMEQMFSKEKILELYLNKAYFGYGAYGLEAAAQAYFSKHAEDLNLTEAAMLAGLLQAPSRFSPTRNIELTTKRRNVVLYHMARVGFIDQKQKKEKQDQPIELNLKVKEQFNEVSYFVEEIRKQLLEQFDTNTLYRGGLKVYTTMDTFYQVRAQRALENGLIEIDKRHGYRGVLSNISEFAISDTPSILEEKVQEITSKNKYLIGGLVDGVIKKITSTELLVDIGGKNARIFLDTTKWARPFDLKTRLNYSNRVKSLTEVFKKWDVISLKILDYHQTKNEFIGTLYQVPQNNGGIIVMEPETGYVLAVSGGFDFEKSEFNRAIQSQRQPGSAFKAITYSAALDQSYTTASILEDTPLVFKSLTNFTWIPKNYNRRFQGKITLRYALAKSLNIPSVKLLMDIGLNSVVKRARNLGITTPISKDYSIALGSSTVTLQEFVSAYSVFANQGRKTKPIFITKVEDQKGNILLESVPVVEQVISPENAFLMTSLLQDVVERGTGRRSQAIQRPSAGKTGTTNGNTDAWYIGYIPQLIAGVYVGNDNPSIPLGYGESGSSSANPIWVNFMKFVVEPLPIMPFSEPSTIKSVKINAKTGLLACESGKDQIFEYFIEGTEPTICNNQRIENKSQESLDELNEL